MKKIFLAVGLFALIVLAACDTSKNSVAASAPPPPPPAPNKPQKGEMQESDMKIAPLPSQKKALPKGKMQPMEAVILQDSVVPKH
jgi:hypothetical protein